MFLNLSQFKCRFTPRTISHDAVLQFNMSLLNLNRFWLDIDVKSFISWKKSITSTISFLCFITVVVWTSTCNPSIESCSNAERKRRGKETGEKNSGDVDLARHHPFWSYETSQNSHILLLLLLQSLVFQSQHILWVMAEWSSSKRPTRFIHALKIWQLEERVVYNYIVLLRNCTVFLHFHLRPVSTFPKHPCMERKEDFC